MRWSVLVMRADPVFCRELAEALGLGLRQVCMREVALLDYYCSGFWWAKESGLSPAQVSFSMAVFQRLLDNIRGGGTARGHTERPVWTETCRDVPHMFNVNTLSGGIKAKLVIIHNINMD